MLPGFNFNLILLTTKIFRSSDNFYVGAEVSLPINGINTKGGYDIVILKYNSSCSLQWTKLYGTSASDYFYEITVDSNDDIYVAGSAGTSGYYGLNNAGLFLMKINSSGFVK